MPMQLGAATFGFRPHTPSKYVEMAAALGLGFVEVPMYEQIKTASHMMESES